MCVLGALLASTALPALGAVFALSGLLATSGRAIVDLPGVGSRRAPPPQEKKVARVANRLYPVPGRPTTTTDSITLHIAAKGSRGLRPVADKASPTPCSRQCCVRPLKPNVSL